MTTKRFLIMLAAIIGTVGAWAQSADEVAVTPTANANEWTLTMPAGNVELQVEYETTLALNETNDNTATLDEWNGYEADVTLSERTLQTGGWNTLALPFDVTAEQMATVFGSDAKAKVLTASSLDEGTLTLTFADATALEAGKPYLVKVTSNVENPVFEGVTVSNTVTATTTTYVDFVPVVNATEIGSEGDDVASVLFVGADNKLYNSTVLPARMKGLRAYFAVHDEAAQMAARFVMNIEGEGTVTGVRNIENSTLNVGHVGVYDLQGRQIVDGKSAGSQLQRGIYIVNGKKIVK